MGKKMKLNESRNPNHLKPLFFKGRRNTQIDHLSLISRALVQERSGGYTVNSILAPIVKSISPCGTVSNIGGGRLQSTKSQSSTAENRKMDGSVKGATDPTLTDRNLQ